MEEMNAIFIHGLESSSRGRKARYFREHFPGMLVPDFTGDLACRLASLEDVLAGCRDLILIGSSFGGLMATIFASRHQKMIKKMILLAPALNFPESKARRIEKITLPCWLHIGNNDTITPPAEVIPAAIRIFRDLHLNVTDDDHFLKKTFAGINWYDMLFNEEKSGQQQEERQKR